MKKVLFFLSLVLAVIFPYFNIATPVSAEETDIVLLTSSNFVSEMTNYENASFKMTENLVFDSWSPIDFSGTLDGNGFTITLDKNLFKTLENANILNLGIIISGTYIFDNTGYIHSNSDFGALAQNAIFSSINKVYAVINVQVKTKSSLNVGGLIGKAEGTTIKNSYVKAGIQVTQFSGEALSTVVGGFVGNSFNSIITNCFAVPISTNIISAGVDETLVNPKTELVLGGFIGLAEKGVVGIISNNFCGGNIIFNYVQAGTEIFIGKIFGEVKGFSDNKLSFCHTFNNQAEMMFIGKANSYQSVRITQKESIFFGEINSFLQSATDTGGDIWNFLYVWDTDIVWTKKETSQFIVLQVFENFSVILETNLNDESLQCEIFVFIEDEFVSTDLINFKFGNKLLINVKVEQDFLHYKQIESLIKTNSSDKVNLVFNDDKSQASYEFTINAKTAGSYYATADNIEYTLIVKTADSNMGYVKYYDITNINQTLITYKIVHGGEYTFVADPRDNSYAFENWCWLDENNPEEKIVALRGPAENNVQASKQISIGFGKQGTSSLVTYLNVDGTPAIPYTLNAEDGSITFTIEANFTPNVCNLSIQSNLDADTCLIYIDGVLQDVIDFTSLFDDSVQIGKSIEITIVMKDNYTFKKWRAGGNKPLANFIGSSETENSQTINLTLSSNFVLILEVEHEVQAEQNLTWLWIVLGILGGAGLTALVIALIVRSSRKKDFLNYF